MNRCPAIAFALREQQDVSIEVAESMVNAVFDAAIALLNEGRSVRISGIGKLVPSARKVRTVLPPEEGGVQHINRPVIALRDAATLEGKKNG